MTHYAKGVACAAAGRTGDAEEHRRQFTAAAGRVPASRTVFNNTCQDILAIAAAMLDGELEYRKGNYGVAFGHLRHAVELDDGLPYDEPWGWMQPARHALGACCSSRTRSPRPRPFTAPISASMPPWPARASTPATSGACTATTNALPGWARTSRPASSGSS